MNSNRFYVLNCLLLSLLLAVSASAQPTTVQPLVRPADRSHAALPPATQDLSKRPPLPQARTSSLSPILLGQASNPASSLIPMNNCVYADDSTGLVLFVHTQDSFIVPGTDQMLRYDISTDGGATWTTEIGPLNPTWTLGRSPQIVGYRPAGNTNPLAGAAIFAAEKMVGGISYGLVNGSANLTTSGNPGIVDDILTTPPVRPGGSITQGRPGEFWAARIDNGALPANDSLRIYKGVLDPGTMAITWAQDTVMGMNWDLTWNGLQHVLTPSVAFSPDGNIGWIATLGDIVGTMDSVWAPILLKSTDGGATWGAPQEIDLNSFPWVADSLRALWLDTNNTPGSTGRATAANHYDLTVDANGNPHLFFVIGSATVNAFPTNFVFFYDLSKYAVDLSTTNQGASFDLRLVAPVLTFRGMIPNTGLPLQENYPQVSRSEDGQYIFYSWIDSDTAQYTGTQNGIGFGNWGNTAPNLRIAGVRLADGYSTCIHLVTDTDPAWNGRALSMQLAPQTLKTGSGPSSVYRLPIVGMDRSTNSTPASCQFHYFGNDAVLTEGDFVYPPGSSVYWLGCDLAPAISARIHGKVFVDHNANGVFDGSDVGLGNQLVTSSPFIFANLSDTAGDYGFSCLINQTYGLTPAPMNASLWLPTAPSAPYSLTPTTNGSILSGNDFGYAPLVQAEDLAVHVYADQVRSPSYSDVSIYVENLGTVPTGGTLVFTYDSLYDFATSSLAYASHDTATRQVTWNLPPIPIMGTQLITATLQLPIGVTFGTMLHCTAVITTPGTDIQPINNSEEAVSIVVGAVDPNDKTVTPPGNGANHQVDPGTTLKYRVRFQNTGTASAIDVVVRDTLESDLNPMTLHMLGASHPYSLAIEQGNILVWSFIGINLPDSNANEPASHGHIDFSIAPQPGLPLGTVVENSVSIYFDFNAPVLTNTAWITYDVPVVSSLSPAAPAIRVYPVPASTAVVVEYQRHDGQPWTLELLDLQGRRVHKSTSDEASYTLARNGLPAGIYLYRVTTVDGRAKTGKLIFD